MTRADQTAASGSGGVTKTIIKKQSPLDARVQHLMELICDLKVMEQNVRKMDFDVQRSPLGKITKAQLKAGFESLTKIEQFIMAGNFGPEFHEAVNQYYTRIPHFFG